MALCASCWAGRLVSFLGLLMTTFAILVGGLFHRKSLPFCLGLMALFAQFARGFAFLPGMMALHTIDFICLGMLLMVKCHFSIRNIEGHLVLCSKSASHHHNGEHKTYNDPNADQFSHSRFTPFLLRFFVPQLFRLKTLTNIHFLVKKKISRLNMNFTKDSGEIQPISLQNFDFLQDSFFRLKRGMALFSLFNNLFSHQGGTEGSGD